jgi:hypothetical protein
VWESDLPAIASLNVSQPERRSIAVVIVRPVFIVIVSANRLVRPMVQRDSKALAARPAACVTRP